MQVNFSSFGKKGKNEKPWNNYVKNILKKQVKKKPIERENEGKSYWENKWKQKKKETYINIISKCVNFTELLKVDYQQLNTHFGFNVVNKKTFKKFIKITQKNMWIYQNIYLFYVFQFYNFSK